MRNRSRLGGYDRLSREFQLPCAQADPLWQPAGFLRERGREDEVAEVEAEIPPLPGGWIGRWHGPGLAPLVDASPAEVL